MQVIGTILIIMYGLFGISSFLQSLSFDGFLTAFVQLVVFLFNFNDWYHLEEGRTVFQVGIFLDMLKLIFWLQIVLMVVEKLRCSLQANSHKKRHNR